MITVEDFDTDEDMKGIDLKDLMSENGDEAKSRSSISSRRGGAKALL